MLTALRFNTDTFFTRAFLFCFSLVPIINLFWKTDLVFLKGNWILYPFIVLAVIASFVFRVRISFLFLITLLLVIFYCAYFTLKHGQFESILRFFFTLIPLAFLQQMREHQNDKMIRNFLIVYVIASMVPVYFSYLQLRGIIPYYEFDVVDGVYMGRISGGYSKPNNFIAILFPFFLLGLYLWKVLRKKFIGFIFMGFVLILVYITGLRIAVFIYFGIIALTFAPHLTQRLIVFYYRYGLNFFTGITTMLVCCLLYNHYGFIDAIRGRVAMWQAHSYEFFYNSSLAEIFFGKARVLLPIKWDSAFLVGSMEEAHNNSLRLIITFGLFGFLFYCLVIRWMVLYVNRLKVIPPMMYIYFSCFFFLILYSITNEPVFYSSIFWAIIAWVILNPAKGKIESANTY
jgi:hypothetical protein